LIDILGETKSPSELEQKEESIRKIRLMIEEQREKMARRE